MGYRFFSLITLFFCLFTPSAFAEGDISFDIQEGAWWKSSAKAINFLAMEGYQEIDKDRLFYFPSANATLSHWPVGPVFLATDQGRREPSALYISIYELKDNSPDISMDIFATMRNSIVQTLNNDLQSNGRLSSDKTFYSWLAPSGAACLFFATVKNAQGKTTPKFMRLILTKKDGMEAAAKTAAHIYGNDSLPASFSSHSDSSLKETTPEKKEKTSLKDNVKTLNSITSIEGIPSFPRNSHYIELLNASLSVLSYYGKETPNNVSKLEKEVSDSVAALVAKTGSSRNIAHMDIVSKLLRSTFQVRTQYLEKLPEGRETFALIKKCDREAKTPFTRSSYSNYYSILFNFPKEILLKCRAGNSVNNERWFKSVKDHIDQGIPIVWYAWNDQVAARRIRIIYGYNNTTKELAYMDRDHKMAFISLENAICYSLWQMIILP